MVIIIMKGSYNLYSYNDATDDDNDDANGDDDKDDVSDDDRDDSLVGSQHNHLL